MEGGQQAVSGGGGDGGLPARSTNKVITPPTPGWACDAGSGVGRCTGIEALKASS